MRYEQPAEGEWVQPIRRGYKMRCCDCGLVHKMDFRVSRGRAQFRVFRDNRATAAIRRVIRLERETEQQSRRCVVCGGAHVRCSGG